MNYMGIYEVSEIEKQEKEKLRAFCKEHYGEKPCEHCHSSTAENWCSNHPKYQKNPERTIH